MSFLIKTGGFLFCKYLNIIGLWQKLKKLKKILKYS